MNFSELIHKRQSVRKYLPKPVSRDIIEKCLEAARLAPSACNNQPWSFIVVDKQELKDKLAQEAFSGVYSMNSFAKNAAALIVVITERPSYITRLAGYFKGVQYSLIDIGIACEHLSLQAAEDGLGTCMLGWFNEPGVRKLLKIPRDKKIDLIVSMGYPETEEIREKMRKPIDEIRKFLSLAFIFSLFSFNFLFAAGEEGRQVAREIGEPRWYYNNSVDTYARYMPSRTVKSMSGKVEIIETNFQYSYEFKLFDQLPIKLSLEDSQYNINESVPVDLPAHLTGVTFDFETTLPFFFENTYFRLGASPSSLSENYTFNSSAFRMPSRYYLVYKPDEKLVLIAGVAVYPDFEDTVLPILGFIYKPNDKWLFNIIPDRPAILYFFNDKITLFGEGGGSSNEEFEVERNGEKGRVLRYKEMHVGAGIKYKINKYIEASAQAGGMFGRSLRYADDTGKVNIHNGLYTEFRMEIKI